MSVDFTPQINNFLSAELGEEVRGSLVDIAEALQAAINSQLIAVDPTLSVSGDGADSAVVGAKFDKTVLFRRTLRREIIDEEHTENNDLNLVHQNGVYFVKGTLGEDISPYNSPTTLLGVLTVFSREDNLYAHQVLCAYGGQVFSRFYRVDNWSEWQELAFKDGSMLFKSTLLRQSETEAHTSANDLNLVKNTGIYFAQGTIGSYYSPYNSPTSLLGVLTVFSRNDNAYVYQCFCDHDGNVFTRIYDVSVWTDWQKISTDKTAAPIVPSLSVKMLQRVGCIGDSYMKGYLKQTAGDTAVDKPEYSWVAHMEHATGHTWTNFAVSGSSSKSWIQGNAKLADVQAVGNKCQAYIIGLGINDSGTGGNAVPVGTIDDIDLSAEPTETNSFFYYYARLIKEVNAVNPTAPIICLTMPSSYTPPGGTERYEPYNEAIRNIVEYILTETDYKAYVCDLKKDYYNAQYFRNQILVSDQMQGHYSGIGYEFFSECLLRCFSDTINANVSDFQGIYKVPYDSVT